MVFPFCRGRMLLMVLSLWLIVPDAAEAVGPGGKHDSSPDGRKDSQRAVVRVKDAPAMAGYLVDAGPDSLFLLQDTSLIPIAYDQLMSVSFMRSVDVGRSIVHGVLAGMYFGNLFFYRAENNATAFYKDSYEWESDEEGNWAVNLLFGLGGGAANALAHVGTFQGTTLFFTGSDKLKKRTINSLRSKVLGHQRRPPLSFTFAFGQVETRNVSSLEDRLIDLGYTLRLNSYVWEKQIKPATDFDLMRKVELSYALLPATSVGFAVLWLDEPFVWAAVPAGTQWVSAKYEATGCFGVVKQYFDLSTGPSGGSRIYVGGGGGVVDVDYNLFLTDYTVSPGPEETTVSLARRPVCGYLCGGIDIGFTRYQSLGLFADYVIGPTYDVDGIPAADLPPDRVRVGNFCLGFTVNYHF